MKSREQIEAEVERLRRVHSQVVARANAVLGMIQMGEYVLAEMPPPPPPPVKE